MCYVPKLVISYYGYSSDRNLIYIEAYFKLFELAYFNCAILLCECQKCKMSLILEKANRKRVNYIFQCCRSQTFPMAFASLIISKSCTDCFGL